VGKLGGRIDVLSEVNKGTTFKITIPKKEVKTNYEGA
jgi:chemotaxis protein histidine kinase CheA